jgi:hypothetical protein
MTLKYLSSILVIALSFVLCIPAEAQGAAGGGIGGGLGQIGPSTGTIVGAVVGVVAAVVVVAIVAIHYSKKRTITGCVKPAQNGMIVNDERDKRVYTLSGDTLGVKPDERMTFQGKKIRPNAGNPLSWEITKIRNDYGVCQP